MKRYENFWTVTIVRGLVATAMGSAVLVVPDMARTILFLPFAVTFVILSLALYGIADSVLVFVTSFFAGMQPARTALRLESAGGVAIGILFCSILMDRIQLHWFLYLIALQAFATGCAELATARHTSRRHGSRWSYAAAGLAALCGVGYTAAAALARANLSAREIAVLAYAYLVAFGVAQILMATRMYALGRRAMQAHVAGLQAVSQAM